MEEPVKSGDSSIVQDKSNDISAADFNADLEFDYVPEEYFELFEWMIFRLHFVSLTRNEIEGTPSAFGFHDLSDFIFNNFK